MSDELAVTASEDFRRIAALPRRDPAELFSTLLAEQVTKCTRLPGGAMTLFPVQAASLVSAATPRADGTRGLFGPIGVSGGKTLISFLLPYVLEAKRPVLLVPGGLVKKTQREFRELRLHFREVPLTILSYEKLGRNTGANLLNEYRPDLLIQDECQATRNDCSVRRVVQAYRDTYKPIFCNMSGSMTAESIVDCAHLARWSLGNANTYLPNDEMELDLWRRALDAEVEVGGRTDPGVLFSFCTDDDKGSKMQRARAGVQRRMRETIGVVATHEIDVAASLRLTGFESPAGIDDDTWKTLRDDWVLPNGEECLDGLEVHREARNFDHGYYGIWDPAPPADWYAARKLWARVVRKAVKEHWCNTEVEARLACETWGDIVLTERTDDGEYRRKTIDPVAARDAWLAIRGTFKPNPVPVWLSTAKLEAVSKWANEHRKTGGIIWTQHVPFGTRLEVDYGIKYYQQEGIARDGQYIEDAERGSVICASIEANYKGRNLQHKWSHNLVCSPYGSAERWEQKLGRTHRRMQKADTVFCDVMIGCAEHVSALRRAKQRAAYIEQIMGNKQKLCYCDWTIELDEYKQKDGWRWVSNVKEETDEDESEMNFEAVLGGLLDDVLGT